MTLQQQIFCLKILKVLIFNRIVIILPYFSLFEIILYVASLIDMTLWSKREKKNVAVSETAWAKWKEKKLSHPTQNKKMYNKRKPFKASLPDFQHQLCRNHYWCPQVQDQSHLGVKPPIPAQEESHSSKARLLEILF